MMITPERVLLAFILMMLWVSFIFGPVLKAGKR